MVVYGQPFYDEVDWTPSGESTNTDTSVFYDDSEWEPDGPTIKQMLGLENVHAFIARGVLLQPYQLQMLQKLMQEEHGRHWKVPFQAFIDELQPVIEKIAKVLHDCEPMVKAMKKPVPRHGPQWNPHARNGKGARR